MTSAPASPGGSAEIQVPHHWRFDGDDPYIICDCGERRDALSGRVITEGNGSHDPHG